MNQRRNKQIPITLTPQEREDLEGLAEAEGTPLATFCARIVQDWLVMRSNPEVLVLLAARAKAEILEIAGWQGLELSALCASVLEDWHRSPSFKSLLDRSRKGESIKEAITAIESQIGSDDENVKRLKRLLKVENNE